MSNIETLNNDQWSDRTLTEAQQKNRRSAEMIPFGERGVTPENFAQVVDFAKMMSTAKGAVPAHLIGNTGACLAVIELAQKFQMSAYMLAMGCFSVNGMLAFTGQTIAAIMNNHMPLEPDEKGKRTRLKYRFEGDVLYEVVDNVDERSGVVQGQARKNVSTLRVIVTGQMRGEADILEYRSPMLKDIKVRNSPLWEEDPEQQLIYFGSKRWQRRWWPEGMLGIYDAEELRERHVGADNARLIESNNPGAALMERISAAKAQTDDADRIVEVEGFRHADAHTFDMNQDSQPVAEAAQDAAPEDAPAPKPKRKGKKTEEPELEPEKITTPVEADAAPEPEPEHDVMPKNPREWKAYSEAWISIETDVVRLKKRWAEERKLRNDCGVTEQDRDPVYDLMLARESKLAG